MLQAEMTDFGKRIQELNRLSKSDLHNMIGSMCGIHVTALSKKQLRRSKRELVAAIMRMGTELAKYDANGMLKSI